jgi:hypothetical protein
LGSTTPTIFWVGIVEADAFFGRTLTDSQTPL